MHFSFNAVVSVERNLPPQQDIQRRIEWREYLKGVEQTLLEPARQLCRERTAARSTFLKRSISRERDDCFSREA